MIDELLKARRSQITTLPQSLQKVINEGRTNPVLFINHLLGMPLHPGQIKYIEDTYSLKTKVNVLVPANRYGKSSLLACLQIHALFYKLGIPQGNREAWFKARYRTANVAPAASLVEPVFQYIDQILTSSFAIRLADGRIVSNKCQIEWFYLKNQTLASPPLKQFFANNSYIEHRTIGLSGSDSLEGKPYGIITYDEGGRSNHLEQELNGTILARLFDWGGQFHLASTPSQDSPSILYHYELYEKGLNRLPGFYTLEGELADNIFFPKAQIEEQYKLYEGNPLRDQVIFGKFVFGGSQLFRKEDILEAKDTSLNDGEPRQEGRKYVIATDTAIGADEMVHSVLDVTDLLVEEAGIEETKVSGKARLVKQTACKGNRKSPQKHLNDFIDLYNAYNTLEQPLPHLLETWNGESVRFYKDMPEHIKHQTQCYGSWQPDKHRTDNKNQERPKSQNIKKSDVLMSLSKLLSAHVLKIFAQDPNAVMNVGDEKSGADLIQQLSIYKEDDNNLPTDRLISLALACWLAIEQNTKQESIQFIDW